MGELNRKLFEAVVNETDVIDDTAVFHENSLIPKEIFYSKFVLHPILTLTDNKAYSITTYSANNCGLDFNNGKYSGLLTTGHWTYWQIPAIVKHKFYINNIVRNNFSDTDNPEKFEKNCNAYYNTIKVLIENRFYLNNRERNSPGGDQDLKTLQDFINKYEAIVKLTNDALKLVTPFSAEKFDQYQEKLEEINALKQEVIEDNSSGRSLLNKVNSILYESKIPIKHSVKDAEMELKIDSSLTMNNMDFHARFVGFHCSSITLNYDGEYLSFVNCKANKINSNFMNKSSLISFYNNDIGDIDIKHDTTNLMLYFKNNKINSITALAARQIFFENDNRLGLSILNSFLRNNEIIEDFFSASDSDTTLRQIVLYFVNNFHSYQGQLRRSIMDELYKASSQSFCILPETFYFLYKTGLSTKVISSEYNLSNDDNGDFMYKLISFLLK
jgi:hypothetical protein